MNVLNLSHALDITSVAGHTLSAEEAYVVKTALLVLQGENHFRDVYFLGKIFGTESDYYVAFGYRSDAFGSQSFFYSNNQCDWFVLSEPSPSALKLAPKVSHRFTGDPSHVVDWREAGDTVGISGWECLLKEEDKLAAVVHCIHEDCAIAPKGAFFQNIQGLIEINPIFQGLSLQQGLDPVWWCQTKCRGKSGARNAGDLLGSSISEYKDKWSFRVRSQGSVCIALSLEWLGFTVYHRLRTSEHGFVYFGDGVKPITSVTSEIPPSDPQK